MDVIITHTTTETSATLLNATDFSNPPTRDKFSSLMYVRETTGNIPILEPPYSPHNPLQDNWILDDLGDGSYKSELLIVPHFDYISQWCFDNGQDIEAGTVVYHSDSLFYRAVVNVTVDEGSGVFLTPDADDTNWDVIDTSSIDNVYNETINNALLRDESRTYYGTLEFDFDAPDIEVEVDVIVKDTIEKTSVVLDISQTVYTSATRGDYAAIMYVNNKKTTGDVPITGIVPNTTNPLSTVTWTMNNVVDGYYKSEVLMIPTFEALTTAANSSTDDLLIGTVAYYNGLFYRIVKQIPHNPTFPTPDNDYNNWEVVNTTKIEDVYNETLQTTLPSYARTFYGYDEFVFFNNLVYAFLDLSAAITKSCNICANPQIEALRCLRDKYESVELAVAAGNYSGAQTIIESSQNLVNSCSC